MHNLYSFVVLAVLATLALAAPTPERITKRSFTVPRIRNPAYVRDPAQAMARAYRKFGWGDLLGSDSVFGFGSGEQGGSGQGASSTSSATTSVASSSNNSDSEDNSGSSESSATSSSAAAATSTTAPFSNSTATSAASAAANSTSSTGETGTVAAKPAESGAEYISPISVGGQSLNMDFDTGSADLWVFSTSLSSSEIGSHATYDPSKSSTFKKLDGYTFSISYGDGSGASGTVGTDTVDIGGATVTSQAVELATAVSSAFVQDANSDGLVGLAFSSLNSVKPKTQNTFYQNIMSSLEQPVFTADLEADGSGTYEFGTIDSSKYTGNISFTPVDASSGFWQFSSPTYSIGGKTATNSGGSPAIADTGTSLLLVDPAVAEAYYAQVSGSSNSASAGGYVYPCSATLPEFEVAIGSDYMANVPSDGITFTQVDDSTCFGGIQSNGGSGLQIYGDALLKFHFVVFDGKNEVLGMANKAT